MYKVQTGVFEISSHSLLWITTLLEEFTECIHNHTKQHKHRDPGHSSWLQQLLTTCNLWAMCDQHLFVWCKHLALNVNMQHSQRSTYLSDSPERNIVNEFRGCLTSHRSTVNIQIPLHKQYRTLNNYINRKHIVTQYECWLTLFVTAEIDEQREQ